MPAKTQQVMWTALPNGLNPKGTIYRVSVLVSPRLIRLPSVPDRLDEFPDFLDWPRVLAHAAFAFELGGLTIKSAALVSDPRSADWQAVFGPKMFVRPYVFEDRRNNYVLSYPVAEIHDFVQNLYADLASQAGDELPTQSDLQGHLGVLREPITLPRDSDIRVLLQNPPKPQSMHGERPKQDVRYAFMMQKAYHRPLAAEKTQTYTNKGAEDPREAAKWRTHNLVSLPQPTDFKDQIDFHQIVSAANQHHELLRRLGLVLDFEIPASDMPDAQVTDGLRVVVKWKAAPESSSDVKTLADSRPATMTLVLPRKKFEAVLKDPQTSISDGFLRLADKSFDLMQVDVDGAGIKVQNFSRSVTTMRGADKHAEQPRAGAPALRTNGLMLAQWNRGQSLKSALERSGGLHDAESTAGNLVLYREDLIRGYHVDIFDETTGKWQSLCRRDGRIELIATANDIRVDDAEGMIRLGATQAADGTYPDVVKLYEGLFAWRGWSLTAPAPGNALDTDDSVGPAENKAPLGMPFAASFTVHPGSLPSLRFGRQYRMRVRVVDLAHNAVGWSAKSIEPTGAASDAQTYLRYEPVEPPALALVEAAGIVEEPRDGESMGKFAIRTLNRDPASNSVPTTEVVRRHVAAPRTSAKQSETHGMIDRNGRVDLSSFALLSTRDSPLPAAPISFDGVKTEYAVAAEDFSLPYLPDPFAHQVAIRSLGPAHANGTLPGVPYYPSASDRWPDALPFQIKIFEEPGATVKFDPANRILNVPLAKADIVRLRLSHLLPPGALEQMGVWQWFLQRHGSSPDLKRPVESRAREGGNWLLTPWLDIELFHAVQKPLVRPRITTLVVGRTLGDAHAIPNFITSVDSRSTQKLDLFGRWNEPDDRLAEPGPRTLNRRGHAFERALEYLQAPGVKPPGQMEFRTLPHEFGDTRYRRVLYRLEATTRFREFMPPKIRNAPVEGETNDQIKVVSDEAVGWVPNAAPPPAPEILYVMPTFGWNRSKSSGTFRSWRNGGGLRVYLNRPWFVSGFNEMLAVVLPPNNASKHEIDRILKPFVTQWGTDPIWAATTVKTPSPGLSRFPLAVTKGPLDPEQMPAFVPAEEAELPSASFPLANLTNPALPADTPVRLNVAPHLVQYDTDRQLWYCDIVVDPGESYYPFIRLALARYHPVSVPGAHLSPVVTTEFVQLTPDRLATVAQETKRKFSVGLYGHAYTGGPATIGRRGVIHRQSPVIEVTVEQLDPKIGGELGWKQVAGATVVRQTGTATGSKAAAAATPTLRTKRRKSEAAGVFRVSPALIARAEKLFAERDFSAIFKSPALLAYLQPPSIWQGIVTLPADIADSAKLRILIKEYERHLVDSDHVEIPRSGPDPRLRLVYADSIRIRA